MPGNIVIGLQWGDEGKGKIIDLLAKNSSHVVRSQGGNNAGHTIKHGEKEIALHLLPSGVLHPQPHVYIGGGCLIDPEILLEEIEKIQNCGIEVENRLHISAYAHVIFPFHRKIDQIAEKGKGKEFIGTTGRGIGPCVADRANRIGIRIAELIRPDIFKKKLEVLCRIKNLELKKIYEEEEMNGEEIFQSYRYYGEKLGPYVSDVEGKLYTALVRDQTVLFEGAQGTLLDGVLGSYPYVTSSSTLAAGVIEGAGVGPTMIDSIYGVLKAYNTRVGSGPLPTSVNPDILETFSQAEDFREVGTTTGRKRRIGWLDLVLARFAIERNGVDNLVLTKLDVLDHFEEILVCTGYSLNGERIDILPHLMEDWMRVDPIYETFPGWMSTTRGARKIRELPKNARAFIDFIEDYCNVPVAIVSVGPSREETIFVDEEFL